MGELGKRLILAVISASLWSPTELDFSLLLQFRNSTFDSGNAFACFGCDCWRSYSWIPKYDIIYIIYSFI